MNARLAFLAIPFLLFAGCGGTSHPVTAASVSAVPPGRIFGLTNVRYVVQSPYAYEANLLDGAIPVADDDYMLFYAASELVTLPPGHGYQYRGALSIEGSGIVSKWVTPNGGHFAFLHLRSSWSAEAPTVINDPKRPGNGDATALIVAAHQQAATVASVRAAGVTANGGQSVGWSGWPSWSEFANGGTPGEADAHLCVVLDARALQWFLHPPRAFPRRIWDSVRVARHEATISPYVNHRLSWVASVWVHHVRQCGGIVRHEQWYRRGGFMKTTFARCVFYQWPRYHATKVVKR